ncbi:MAG: MBL fold metallo-hydrolase [Halobacteriaceae archaeon]
MRLTFLGTGSAMPDGERAQAGLLVQGGDVPLLVDCGSGVLERLERTAVGYEGVGAVLLTHHHLDHVADLLPLLKARWLAGADPIELVGPPGTASLLDDLLGVHDYLADHVDPAVREVTEGSISVAGLDARAAETRHSMQCFAYRFGDALAVSGDTEADPGLAAFADGVAALVHDCSFPDGVDVSNHPTPSQLGRALSGNDYGRVYLTHLYPHTRGKEEAMLDSLGEYYDGEARFATGGETVVLDAG